MLEQMTKNGWAPVLRNLELNSDEKAVLAELLETKIDTDDRVNHLHFTLKRKIDALTF